jgi:hypothetical protein
MRRAVALAALLALSGCISNPFRRPYDAYGDAPPDSLRGQCERAAYDDPQVKEALARTAGAVGYDQGGALQRLAAVKRDAVERCLNRRGGGVAGGVELPHR